MAAYAALVSLMHIIDDIENHHSPPISLHKQQLQSLTQNLTFFQDFLEGYVSPVADSDEADRLEMRIADAAYAAEDVIESNIVENIQQSRSKDSTERIPQSVPSSVDANHNDEQIKSTKLYQDFLKGYISPVTDSDEADSLEMRIADAAEDVIESNIVENIQLSRSKFNLFFTCFRRPKIPQSVSRTTKLYQDHNDANIVEKIQLSRSKFNLFFNCFRRPKIPQSVSRSTKLYQDHNDANHKDGDPPIAFKSVDANHNDEQIKSTKLYQDFLEGYISSLTDNDEADSLEMRIADAAYAAEDVIESTIVEKIQLSRSNDSTEQIPQSVPSSVDANHNDEQIKSTKLYQDFLESYISPVADSNEPDPLEMRIADAAYAAEDVIESNIVENIQFSRSKDSTEQISQCVPSSADANHNDEQIKSTKLYQDLQQVVVDMDVIKKELMKIDTAEKGVVKDQRPRLVPARVDSSSSKSSIMFSEDVLNGIMEKVVARDSDHRVVIPIVGMGGIGKTTLARTIYSKQYIEYHFYVRAWATISQQYNTRDILSELLSQAKDIDKEKLREMNEGKLGYELHQCLYRRRFLIVLDDMWSIDAWDRVQCFLPDNQNGSRVLVTTRLSQLSSQLNNNYSLPMEFLDEVTSWDLFSETVFGNDSCPRELENIGKKIVENCRGLPLSIVVVGGLLKKMEQTKRRWESISNNLTSLVNSDNDKHCLRLLKTSYNHLPVHLKACFLYMGVFEEDAEIKVSTLVKLWVCEGFLKPIKGKSLETIAKDLLNDLIDRNLVRIDELGSTGNVKICKIHDLLRDFCLNEGKKEGLYHVVGQDSPRGISSERRVVIQRNTSEKKVHQDLQSTPRARSVIISEDGIFPLCQNLKMLRILHGYKSRTIHDESYQKSRMFPHVNSRYLVIEVHRNPSFFSSINLLWNIHTLIISCNDKSTAPAEIWKLRRLRRIEFVERSLSLPDPPTDGVTLENLRTVKGVENFKCGEEVIRMIPNIKKLEMKYVGPELHDITEHNDYYCLSNIERLCKLECLHVSYTFYTGDVAYLHKLTFPNSLKVLHIDMKGKFAWDEAMEKIGSLPLLQKLKLWTGCFRTGTLEIVEGQFPSLKYLGLFSCFGLKRLKLQEEVGSLLPCLESIHLFYLQELEEIDSEIGNIPTLKKIWVQYCCESAVKSTKVMVDEQMEYHGDQLPFQLLVSLPNENDGRLSIMADYIALLNKEDTDS